jgi:hypothetical protein
MKKRFTVFIFVLLIVVCLFFANPVSAEGNTEFNINSTDLYSQTNTYDYTGLKNPNEERYNMSLKNGNDVSDEKPLLTVLTHGLGGEAMH